MTVEMDHRTTGVVDKLVERAFELYEHGKSKNERVIISISGAPGSGKSTLAKCVCEELNKRIGGSNTVVLPQDGFHYYLEQLANMENPKEMVERRGAPSTFDNKGLLNLVKQVKFNNSEPIYAPDFDHETKNPSENAIIINPTTKVVLLEGNYIQLKDPVWNEISNYVNEKWMVSSNLEEIKRRIIERHVAAGICRTHQEAKERAEANDLINAVYVIDNSQQPDLIIEN